MGNLTLREKFCNITGLTFDLQVLLDSVKTMSDDKKVALLKKIIWFMPDGAFKDNNTDIIETDADFISDVINELEIEDVNSYFEDKNSDGIVDIYDIINAPSQTTKIDGTKIWYTTTDGEIYDFGEIIEKFVSTGEITYTGPSIVSNVFDKEKQMWCMTFNGDVTALGIVDIESDRPTLAGPIFASNIAEEGLTCNVKTVILPETVTNIGTYAFVYCTGLISIEIPDSVISISELAFGYCTGLTSVTIPNSVISIGGGAFVGCTGLTSIEIPNSVTSIEDNVFEECTGLASIKIPDSITNIGNYAFEHCSSLTNIEIPNSVTNIGEFAFKDCNGLTSIEIPNNVINIGESAFMGCTSLTSITIPNSVTSIGTEAFINCTGLNSIICKTITPPSIGNYALDNTNNCPIYVPSYSVNDYKTSWTTYADKIVCLLNSIQIKYVAGSQLTINDGVDCVEHTFDNETGVGIVTFGSILTRLESFWFEHTFSNYTDNIKSLTLPNDVLAIEMSALYGANTVYYEGTQKECARIEKDLIDSSGVEEIHCFDGIVSASYTSNIVSPLILAGASWLKDLLGEETFNSYLYIVGTTKIDEHPMTVGEFISTMVDGTSDVPGLSTYGFTVVNREYEGITIPLAYHTESGHFIRIIKATDYAQTDLEHIAPVATDESLDPDYMYILIDDTIINS